MTCNHCDCPQEVHLDGRNECQECSCLQFLGPDGLPLPEAPTAKPTNLDNADAFVAADVAPGTKLHLAVVGNHVTDDATFLRPHYRATNSVLRCSAGWQSRFRPDGIVVLMLGQEIELPWGDLLECWPVAPDDPDNLNSAAKLRRAEMKKGARLQLDLKSRVGGSEPVVSRYVRFEDFDEGGLQYVMYNDDVLRAAWPQVIECRLILRPDEVDPRYADGRPPDD